MRTHYLTLFITTVLITSVFASEVCINCVKNSDCSCNTNKYGEVSLKGIAGDLGYLEVSDKTFTYRYYPCEIKEDWGKECTVQNGPAFCQQIPNNPSFNFMLGVLSSMSVQSFDIQGGVTVFNYTGGTKGAKTPGNRSSEITLVCDSNAIKPVFEIVEERPILHYRFRLTSHRVCPGLMDDGCQRIDSCTCKLDNNKGIITVHGVLEDLKREWLEIDIHGASYSLFPCPFKTNKTAYKYCFETTGDPAACMETANGEKFTLGLKTEMKFIVTDTDPYTVAVLYYGGSTIDDTALKATLVLQCDMNATRSNVEFLEENPWLVYNFRIKSKVMCPHW